MSLLLVDDDDWLVPDVTAHALVRTFNGFKFDPLPLPKRDFMIAAARYVDDLCRLLSTSPTVNAMFALQPSLKKVGILTGSIPTRREIRGGREVEVALMAHYNSKSHDIEVNIDISIGVEAIKSLSLKTIRISECLKRKIDLEIDQGPINHVLATVKKTQAVTVGHEYRHGYQDALGLLPLEDVDDLTRAIAEADAKSCELTIAAEKYQETGDPFYVMQPIRENPVTAERFFDLVQAKPHSLHTGEAANIAFESFFLPENFPSHQFSSSAHLPLATPERVQEIFHALKGMPYINKNNRLIERRQYMSGLAISYDEMVAAIR